MIASVGYMGSVSDSEWAAMASHLGMRCWVAGAGDLAPSVTSASARQVQVAAGTAGGSGVMDVLDVPESVTLVPLVSGSRVDIVVLRRSWTPAGTPTGTTSVAVVSGASLSAALAALHRSPGTVEGDDQPVAAFQVTASGGTSSVSLLADLRVWAANGGMVAASADVLPAVDEIGTTVRVGTDTWTRATGPGGASWTRTVQHQVVPGPALVGVPPAGTQFVIQGGTVVTATDSSGFGRVTWPQPFPKGLLTVLLSNGDDYAAQDVVIAPAGIGSPWGTEALGTTRSVVYTMRTTSGAVVRNKQHRVNWVAIGW